MATLQQFFSHYYVEQREEGQQILLTEWLYLEFCLTEWLLMTIFSYTTKDIISFGEWVKEKIMQENGMMSDQKQMAAFFISTFREWAALHLSNIYTIETGKEKGSDIVISFLRVCHCLQESSETLRRFLAGNAIGMVSADLLLHEVRVVEEQLDNETDNGIAIVLWKRFYQFIRLDPTRG